MLYHLSHLHIPTMLLIAEPFPLNPQPHHRLPAHCPHHHPSHHQPLPPKPQLLLWAIQQNPPQLLLCLYVMQFVCGEQFGVLCYWESLWGWGSTWKEDEWGNYCRVRPGGDVSDDACLCACGMVVHCVLVVLLGWSDRNAIKTHYE